MKRRKLLAVAGAIALLTAAWAHGPAPTPNAISDAEGKGYRVYIDPTTGAVTSEPTGAEPITLDKEMQNALSTSSKGLRVEQSPVEGGGIMIQLDGRFRNASLATVDEDGRAVVPCVTALPEHADAETNTERSER